MELNYSQIFNEKLIKSIKEYCQLNNVDNIDGFIKKCFDSGFNIEKYGLLGNQLNEDEKDLKTSDVEEKQLIKEVIVEKRVEIPVEVIKEVVVEKEIIKEVPVEKIKEIEKVVEVIKEVPVEKVVEIIKEVPVDRVIEKEIFITDNQQINELGEKITRLEENIFHLEKQLEEERKIFSIKTQELEKIFQKEMSKKDVELDEVRRNLDIKLDNTNEKMLQETLQKLRKELLEKDEKIKELTKLNQDQQNTKESKLNAIFLKGSNLK